MLSPRSMTAHAARVKHSYNRLERIRIHATPVARYVAATRGLRREARELWLAGVGDGLELLAEAGPVEAMPTALVLGSEAEGLVLAVGVVSGVITLVILVLVPGTVAAGPLLSAGPALGCIA